MRVVLLPDSAETQSRRGTAGSPRTEATALGAELPSLQGPALSLPSCDQAQPGPREATHGAPARPDSVLRLFLS